MDTRICQHLTNRQDRRSDLRTVGEYRSSHGRMLDSQLLRPINRGSHHERTTLSTVDTFPEHPTIAYWATMISVRLGDFELSFIGTDPSVWVRPLYFDGMVY